MKSVSGHNAHFDELVAWSQSFENRLFVGFLGSKAVFDAGRRPSSLTGAKPGLRLARQPNHCPGAVRSRAVRSTRLDVKSGKDSFEHMWQSRRRHAHECLKQIGFCGLGFASRKFSPLTCPDVQEKMINNLVNSRRMERCTRLITGGAFADLEGLEQNPNGSRGNLVPWQLAFIPVNAHPANNSREGLHFGNMSADASCTSSSPS